MGTTKQITVEVPEEHAEVLDRAVESGTVEDLAEAANLGFENVVDHAAAPGDAREPLHRSHLRADARQNAGGIARTARRSRLTMTPVEYHPGVHRDLRDVVLYRAEVSGVAAAEA